MPMLLTHYYKAGYLATQTSAYFSKYEITKLLEHDSIEQVQAVYKRNIDVLETHQQHWQGQLEQSIQLLGTLNLDLPESPTTSFDYYYWLDIFHREVMRNITNGSSEENAFLYGYDFGYAYSHTELLRFITELQILLPMQLSYNKQTDHLLRNITSTQHRLASTATNVGTDNDTYIMWDQWKNIDALLEQVRHLNYMSVEHAVVTEQESVLANITDTFNDINLRIQATL